MAATKTVNYTPEQTQEMVQAYQAGSTVEQIAEALNKSTRSVVAKLSREGVYKAKNKPTSIRVKKSELVDQIAHSLGVAPEVVDSLEKTTHEVLELLVVNLK